MEKSNEAVEVNSNYEILGTKSGVLIKIPSAGDPELKWVEEHKIVSLDGPYIVAEHYRRGQRTLTNKNRFITKRFFLGPEYFGKTILAKVEVVKRIDRFREDEFIILNIFPIKPGIALFDLKIKELQKKQAGSNFLVPGTRDEKREVDEYVVFRAK